MGEYDKQLAIATMSLKAEGQPVTIIKTLAEGRISDLLIKRIVAEETLKAYYCNVSRVQAQLNALQSLFRQFDNLSVDNNG